MKCAAQFHVVLAEFKILAFGRYVDKKMLCKKKHATYHLTIWDHGFPTNCHISISKTAKWHNVMPRDLCLGVIKLKVSGHISPFGGFLQPRNWNVNPNNFHDKQL